MYLSMVTTRSIITSLIFSPFIAFGQAEPYAALNSPIKVTNYYQKFSLGNNRTIVRDFATSPLFHSGNGVNIGIGSLKRSNSKERLLEINVNANRMSANIPESNYLQASNASTLINLNLRYLRLWELKKYSSNKYNLKIGGGILISQNFRTNLALQNNASGLENLTNMMLSGQLTRDISRKESKQLKLLFFKPTLKPVKRELRFQVNVGFLNLNYRPSYAYLFHASMGNADKSDGKANELSLNGWRLNTEVELLKHRVNGNATSWSYVWDALNAPGAFESFQMASHQIRYTYYFQTKQK